MSFEPEILDSCCRRASWTCCGCGAAQQHGTAQRGVGIGRHGTAPRRAASQRSPDGWVHNAASATHPIAEPLPLPLEPGGSQSPPAPPPQSSITDMLLCTNQPQGCGWARTRRARGRDAQPRKCMHVRASWLPCVPRAVPLYLHDADVGLNGAEGEVGGLRLSVFYQRVEQRRLRAEGPATKRARAARTPCTQK